MTSPPTVLIVHGAFHVPQHFEHLASLLQQAGYCVDVPALPSVGIEQDPGNALELDADFLCDRLEELVVGEGRDTVVLMHSYGGQCGSEAVASFLEQQEQRHRPNPLTSQCTSDHGSIVHLVYLNAPLLSPGTTFHSTFPSSPNDSHHQPPEISPQGLMTLPASTAQSLFFSPVVPYPIASWATSLLRPQAASIGTTAATYGGFGWARYRLPVTYIGSRLDRMIGERAQEGMIAQLREHGVEVEACWLDDADHGAFLTHAEGIAGVVGRCWR
ncbi:hypothetical protein KC360_g9029 [Hortaea werneckii]|nr:hypothetical protein KC325_g9024 [Hortaea werneckii]KAI6985510.1 hypothetical protein KC359_g9125 [Hortaea werneckii]KAI7144942.1 hypothetical protein KC344_g4941 [Hortaea werneckii]KAI7166786.1 hypothetical protein KC360_g9029 [Hortaea werneckii]KAI7507447.1 hypothetical protein KC347_g6874 [Hortaea werneckii]